MSRVTLSPPWFTFANEIKFTYGLSNYIEVNDLIANGANYDLIINVCNDSIAKSLRAILPLSKDFGGVLVNVIVLNSRGIVVPVENIAYTSKTLAETFCNALYSNPLFVGTVIPVLPPIVQATVGDVVIIIKPCVIQFYDDNISDLCSNFNEVASKVFTDVTTLEYAVNLKVSFSTYDKDCPLQEPLYCPTRCRCR